MAMAGCCARKMSLVNFRSLIVGNQLINRALKLSSIAHLQDSLLLCGPVSNLHKHFSSSPVFSVTKNTSSSNSLPLVTETRKKRRMFDSDDALTHQLSNFTVAEELLEFVETIPSQDFHERAVEVTVNNLFVAVKDIQSPTKKKDILRSVGSQKLNRIIKAHARSMDAFLLTTLLKYYAVLDTPASHPTFQIILRLLTKQANFLTLQQIAYIYFLLERLHPDSRSSMSEAFMLALPVVFESQLDIQLGGLKIGDLATTFRYACTTKLSNSSVEKIIKAILEKQYSLDLPSARTILHGLLDYNNFVSGSDVLLPRVFEVLTQNINSLDSFSVQEIINKCGRRYPHGFPHFYNEDFVEAACNKFLECTEEVILTNVKNVSVLRHVNIDLLEATADIIQKNPSVILNNDSNFVNVMRAFSNAGYKPENWNRIKMMLLDHPSLTKINVAVDVPLAVDYLTLDALPPVLIDKIFSQSYFPHLDAWYEKSGPFSLLMIANAVHRLYPEYQGNMATSLMIQKWESRTKRMKNRHNPLQGALEVGLNNSSNVATNVLYNGILIDHCVLLDQSGSPIPFQEPKPEHLVDIYVPEGCKLVLLKVFQPEAYSNNTSRLRGIHTLCVKVLKTLGSVVEINARSWVSLLDHEKIPYLLQKLKEQAEKSEN